MEFPEAGREYVESEITTADPPGDKVCDPTMYWLAEFTTIVASPTTMVGAVVACIWSGDLAR